MENTRTLGDLLATHNIRKVAKRIGRSHMAVYRWVNEESVPSIGDVPKLAAVLNMDPTELFYILVATENRIAARRKAA